MKFLVLLYAVFFIGICNAQRLKTENVVLITLDGLRWQEVFRGVDEGLLKNKLYTKGVDALRKNFWHQNQAKRAELLMPFLWKTISHQGVLIGNRDNGSYMNVTNPAVVSYPGYSEIFTGYVDPSIDSNKKIWNPNVNVLEWIENQAGFAGKVSAFGSWNALPYILNTKRATNLTVNAGFVPVKGDLSNVEKWLNQQLADTLGTSDNTRFDAFTQGYAIEHIKKHKPRFIYIGYGDTDNFAHDGRYDLYLKAAHRSDRFIAELWDLLQQDPHYKDKTTMIITTDHGRGEMPQASWKHHGTALYMTQSDNKEYTKYQKTGIVGSDQIWAAVIGPDTPSKGLIQGKEPWQQNQIAATIASFLNLDYNQFQKKAGAPIKAVFNN
ncbi:hypothetical protein CMT41_09370 [Colwellia sp. MT41]|uniref:alkaline phosphatase family protein n=1 Tax=Colwellia sp. MT41 TaxID=58049 RepID=UPI000717B971|nr:alkaline phosphatase family protein [Colwellia sp. MT41]ALO34905.1 hypothetical protein CMT41_09370 [Colwellia sp. MT41]